MRRSFALALTALLLFAAMAPANYRHIAGSVYVWAPTGQYYQYYAPGYYAGCYYPQGYYQHLPNYAPATNVTVNLPATPPANWKTELLAIAKQREDELAYLTAIQLLGLGRPGAVYANAGGYSGVYGITTTSTGYGYSVAQVQDLYNQTNVNALFQQMSQLATGQQQLSGDAVDAFAKLLGQEAGNNAKLLEIRARTEALRTFLQHLQQPTTTTTALQATTGAVANPGAVLPSGPAAPANLDAIRAAWAAAATGCVQCHSNDQNKKGNFIVADFVRLTRKQRAVVLDRVDPQADAKVRMPRNADGSAGTLNAQQWSAWRQMDAALP